MRIVENDIKKKETLREKAKRGQIVIVNRRRGL